MNPTLAGLVIIGFGLAGSVALAATDTEYAGQVKAIAEEENIPFDARKPVLPQTLEIRDALRERVATVARMTSRHTLRCKRIRRQLLEVNYLIREMRAED